MLGGGIWWRPLLSYHGTRVRGVNPGAICYRYSTDRMACSSPRYPGTRLSPTFCTMAQQGKGCLGNTHTTTPYHPERNYRNFSFLSSAFPASSRLILLSCDFIGPTPSLHLLLVFLWTYKPSWALNVAGEFPNNSANNPYRWVPKPS